MYYFKRDNTVDSCGTSLKGHILARYRDLERLFGIPNAEDEFKVSGCWVFTDSDGNVVTLYDWKRTNLYDEALPSVEEFRSNNNPVTFNIGGNDYTTVRLFISELSHTLETLSEG
jgi:mRNA-degrading endonuclease HigB of HigAB toxin-antitoxin module